MKVQMLRSSIAFGVSLIALAHGGAMAQQADPQDETEVSQVEEEAEGRLGTIMVTAERKQASVQDTPIAISAFGGDQLQSEHITNIESLATKIPNVQFSKALGMARVFIRGVGLDAQSPGSDPRVAIYTDGVYSARPQGGFDSYFDVERVEVLNGPQGTLYGRNATAGAVNIITRDPTDEFEGFGSVTFGNYRLVQTEGAISGPLGDNVSGRLAFSTSNRDGFGRNILTGADANYEDRQAFRGKLLVRPTEDLRVLLSADYSYSDGGGSAFLGNTPGNLNYGQQQGYEVPQGYDAVGINPGQQVESSGASITANLRLGDGDLASITGFRHLDLGLQGTADFSTASFLPLFVDEESDAFTQELRYAQSVGPVDVLVGGYYFHEKNSGSQIAQVSSGLIPALVASGGGSCCIGIPQQTGPFVLLNGAYFGATQTTDAYALFTQETINLTDRLALDLGLRYSYEERSIDQFYQFDLARPVGSGRLLDPTTGPVGATLSSDSESWDSFDPKVTLRYNFTPDVMGYATYSTGYKSGGFNFAQIQPAFAPEELTDYEVGLKADLLADRLRMNLAAFHYDYTNLQVNTVVLTSLLTTNAGRAEIDGFEAQISASPVPELLMNLSLSYLDARYTEFTTLDPGQPLLGPQDLSGNQLQYAPSWKIGGDISYTIDTEIGAFTPRLDLTWTDDVYFSQFNEPFTSQDAYLLSNLFLDWDSGDGWKANVFVRNLGDERYAIAGVRSTLIVGGHVTGTLAEPRTYGVSLTREF